MSDRIYNKCSIPSLLSNEFSSADKGQVTPASHIYHPERSGTQSDYSSNYIYSQNKSDEERELEEICSKLRLHINEVSMSQSHEFPNISADVSQVCEKIVVIKQKNGELSLKENELLSIVHKLSVILLLLMEEKQSLQVKVQSFQNKYTPIILEQAKPKIVFNVLTQSMISEYGCDLPHKGHRLPKHQVSILDKWYTENLKNPYLSEATLQSLVEGTKLTKSQVRNWVSNKRRKEKVVTVSQELAELLE